MQCNWLVVVELGSPELHNKSRRETCRLSKVIILSFQTSFFVFNDIIRVFLVVDLYWIKPNYKSINIID